MHLVAAALAILVAVQFLAWRKLGSGRLRVERDRAAASALAAQRAAEQRVVVELARRARETSERALLTAEAVRLVREVLVSADVELLDPPATGDGGLVRPATAAGASVVVRGHGDPFGVLCVRWPAPAQVDDATLDFLETVAYVVGSALDHSASEDATRRQSLTDALTGLPNRTLFNDRLERALAGARRRDSAGVAVLLLDIDQFKVINDSLGHQAGDELIVALAPRLRAAVRESDTVARLGGDEFVILCEGVADEEEALELADRVGDAFREPLRVEGRELFVTASTGVAVARPGDTPSTLLRHADAAMYRAKEAGRGSAALYDDHMRGRALDRLRLENDLRRALDRDELSIVYQPIVDVQSGRTCGVEALLRWTHSERGPVRPDVFIPVAEETGLIEPIGRWVLERACAQAAEWQRTVPGAAELELSVNVSAHQVFRGSLRSDVERALRESGIAPGTLGLEITESVLMGEGEPLILLAGLRGAGARLVLDDFGTGYSSLSYIKRFPLDVLKIDRSFVDGLGSDAEDSAIVTTIVSMAQTLGLGVVAEGVETEAQLGQLRELGCERAQGYLFSRPLPPSELESDGVLWGASLLPARPRV